MAKVKILNIDKVSTSLKKEIKLAARSEDLRQSIGETVVKDIKKKNFGTPQESTIKWRKKNEKFNQTDPSYGRSRINITFTGELLEDLKNNVRTDTTGGEIKFEIGHSSKLHKKYNKQGGKAGGKRSTYQEISSGIIDKWGHNYLKFSDKTLRKVLKLVRSTILRKVK